MNARPFNAVLIALAPLLISHISSPRTSTATSVFAKGTFAPTKTAWSVDNRTAGFRLLWRWHQGVFASNVASVLLI